MAFNSKTTVINNQPQQPVSNQPIPPPSELELEELDFLLRVLGNADLKGHQVEMFYNMIVKLQSMYLQKTKK